LTNTKKWTFTYLGANQDLSKISTSMNIPLSNMQKFMATSDGILNASIQTSNAVGSYYDSRATGQTSVTNFYDSSQVAGGENSLEAKLHENDAKLKWTKKNEEKKNEGGEL
jgi:hypothetical protein